MAYARPLRPPQPPPTVLKPCERERRCCRIPICAYCRRIRDDQDYWQALERYVAESGGVRFSHGVCPDCAHKVEEELAAIRDAMKRE